MSIKLNHAAVAHAHALIAQGKIEHGEWNGGDAIRNASTCLGHDEAAKGTEGEWKYPVVSGGKVNAKGVGSAAAYADKDGASDIAGAARSISEAINKKGGMTASADGAYILHLDGEGEGKPFPAGLEGYPTVN